MHYDNKNQNIIALLLCVVAHKSKTHMESLSLPEIFAVCSSYFTTALEEASDEKLEDMIRACEQAQLKVRQEALFSKGEEIDEHPTSSLKVRSSFLPVSPRRYVFGLLTAAKKRK